MEVYDPGTNTWKQVADMNMCRRNAGNTSTVFILSCYLDRHALNKDTFRFEGVCKKEEISVG